MYEAACEPYNTCNNDQYSFKAYLARWMAKAAVVYPSIKDNVRKYLSASAAAAAQSCTGGDDKQTCGQKWYVGGYDGVYGVGQELSAMETVQSLLLLNDNPVVPRHEANVTVQNIPITSEFPLDPTVTPGQTPLLGRILPLPVALLQTLPLVLTPGIEPCHRRSARRRS